MGAACTVCCDDDPSRRRGGPNQSRENFLAERKKQKKNRDRERRYLDDSEEDDPRFLYDPVTGHIIPNQVAPSNGASVPPSANGGRMSPGKGATGGQGSPTASLRGGGGNGYITPRSRPGAGYAASAASDAPSLNYSVYEREMFTPTERSFAAGYGGGGGGREKSAFFESLAAYPSGLGGGGGGDDGVSPGLAGRSSSQMSTTHQDPLSAEEVKQQVDEIQQNVTLTRIEQAWIAEADTVENRLLRLSKVEEQRRAEIYGTYRLTKKFLDMGHSRIRPILRPRTSRMRSGSVKNDTTNNSTSNQQQQPGLSGEANGTGNNKNGNENNSDGPSAAASAAFTENDAIPMQILKLSGNNIPHGQKCQPYDAEANWDILSIPGAPERLCKGECCFAFKCSPIAGLDEEEKSMVQHVCELTGFQPSDVNYLPPVEWTNPKATEDMTIIMVKTMYIAPGFDCTKLTATHFASLAYQKACQPGSPKFEEATFARGDNTMRFRKTIVKFIFSLMIQLKVHEINDPAVLDRYKNIDGMAPAKIILMERTKRDPTKVDSTVMMKSLVLYYPITGGTLICNYNNVVNKNVPGWIAKIVNAFGSSGMAEAAETATLTKAYLKKTFG